MQICGHLLAVQKFDMKGKAVSVVGYPQAGKTLAALNLRTHSHGLQPVEIRQPVWRSMISPAQPERL